jgi:hypothetical protein
LEAQLIDDAYGDSETGIRERTSAADISARL